MVARHTVLYSIMGPVMKAAIAIAGPFRQLLTFSSFCKMLCMVFGNKDNLLLI